MARSGHGGGVALPRRTVKAGRGVPAYCFAAAAGAVAGGVADLRIFISIDTV